MTHDASPELRRALREVLTPEQPLGPPDAAAFSSDNAMLGLLYDPDNRIHERAERSGAPFVIGRKGSGKTAFVTAPKLRDGVVAVELPSADVYQGVFDVIRMVLGRSVTVFPEHSARLWRHLVWCGVLAQLAPTVPRNRPQGKAVHDFIASLGPSGRLPSGPEQAISGYLGRLRAQIEQAGQLGGLGELLNAFRGNNQSITEAIEAGTAVLKASGQRVLVIVDSLEQYEGVIPSSGVTHSVERVAFEGLFQFVGKDGTAPDRPFDIRFAFPAELWPLLEKVSANPAKDFHRKVIAQWSAHELIRLAGTRLAAFAELHGVDDLVVGAERPPFATVTYNDARALLGRVLPGVVHNGIGKPEDPIAYVMRHTQLLPRHLVMILNSIWDVHRGHDVGAPLPVDSRAVVEGVRQAELGIVSDILASYRQVHPDARMCCERVIPNLKMVFTEGELHQAYNRNGIRKETGMEFREFQRMLVEIGGIGVEMAAAATSRYVVGEFEYTRPGSLYVASESRLCLHPVFAEVYNCLESTSRLSANDREQIKPVYPYGSDPNTTVDYRDVA